MISVIVPIYKVEAYLPRCIESILNQTLSDIEVILVNDGSPDRCGQICDEYARKDNRIRVLHKENGGQSHAQNEGIKASKGDFITFVDGDDYICPNMLEFLLRKIECYDADISTCSSLRNSEPFFEDTNSFDESDVLLSGIQAMEDLFVAKSHVYGETWGKLFKAKLFTQTGISFPNGYISGDQFTTYKLLFHAQRIVCTNQRLYFYTQRDGSITGSSFSPQRLNVIEAGKQAVNFVRDKELSLENQSWCFYVGINVYLVNQVLGDENWRKWIGILKELRLNILSSLEKCGEQRRFLPKQRRFSIALLRMGYWCYIPARKLWARKD